MNTHVLKEEAFDDFIQKEILPLCEDCKDAKVFALVGDLGAGKTTFSKKFLHALGVKESVTSPTFSIINSYDISYESFEKAIHIDVYRIEDIKELDVLHFDEIISQKNSIVVIEWADMIKEKIPSDAIWIEFEHDTNETRKVILDSRLRGNDDKIHNE